MVVRPSERKKILMSGIFVTVLFALAVFIVFNLGKDSSWFRSVAELKIRVENTHNLKNGAVVKLRGLKVGTVKGLHFESLENLIITFTVDPKYLKWVKADSYVVFRTQGLLGDRFLEILGGTEVANSLQNQQYMNVKEDTLFDKLANNGDKVLEIATRVLERTDHMLAKLEDGKFDRIISNLESTTGQATRILASINDGKIRNAVENFNKISNKLNRSSDSIQKITGRIEKGPGTLHSLIYDDGLYQDIKTLMGGAQRNKTLKYFIRESIKKADVN